MLTKTIIDQAQPQTAPYIVWDGDLAGFGCRIFPSGKKSFIAQYRMPGNRRAILQTLGRYGLLTVPEARAAARKTLAQAHTGTDPLIAKKQRRAAEATRAAMLTVGSWSNSISQRCAPAPRTASVCKATRCHRNMSATANSS